MTRDKTTLAFYVAFYIYSCYTSFIEILQVWRWVFLKYLWILTIRTFEMTCGSLKSEKNTLLHVNHLILSSNHACICQNIFGVCERTWYNSQVISCYWFSRLGVSWYLCEKRDTIPVGCSVSNWKSSVFLTKPLYFFAGILSKYHLN